MSTPPERSATLSRLLAAIPTVKAWLLLPAAAWVSLGVHEYEHVCNNYFIITFELSLIFSVMIYMYTEKLFDCLNI